MLGEFYPEDPARIEKMLVGRITQLLGCQNNAILFLSENITVVDREEWVGGDVERNRRPKE